MSLFRVPASSKHVVLKKTDQLIEEIIYDLYDLTDEEIAIVEEAVPDD